MGAWQMRGMGLRLFDGEDGRMLNRAVLDRQCTQPLKQIFGIVNHVSGIAGLTIDRNEGLEDEDCVRSKKCDQAFLMSRKSEETTRVSANSSLSPMVSPRIHAELTTPTTGTARTPMAATWAGIKLTSLK